MKVKTFANEGDVSRLEDAINEWLHESKIAPLHIKQSYAYDSKGDMMNTLISIWYEEVV